MPNGVKLHALQDVKRAIYLGFSIFLYFDHHFKEIIAYKIQNCPSYSRTGIYVMEIHTKSTDAKFKFNIFVFGCAMAKKNK